MLLLVSIVVITISPNVYGEKISVTSVALEETSLLELTNESNEEINTLRLWLGTDFSFKSYKTEKGWTGEKNLQGVIVFTSSEPIKPGESVKFGVKTDKPTSGINWKALDEKDTQVDTGISIAKGLPQIIKESDPKDNLEESGKSMTNESVFKIIPKDPNVGSSIRVTGDNFGTLQEFDFYIDSKKIGDFETDKNGHFMTTMKIPDNQKADRADFKIISKDGEEKKISIRIGESIDDRVAIDETIPLTIKGIPSIIYRGDFLEVSGTGDPHSAITADITSPDGDVINSRTAVVDSKGDWKVEDPILVPIDTPFGKYSAIISDGRESKTIYWTVESDKKIIIIPTNLKINKGEVMKFNGTAIPNQQIEIILEDPLGNEVSSDVIDVDDSGLVEFEFPTTLNTSVGTYTLIATQGKEKEFTYAGIETVPIIPVNIEFDKLNYKAGETAIITLSGEASEIISLLIIDPSDKPIDDPISITLQPDGRGTQTIMLKGYASGVYTAVASKGSAQSTEIFTVGLVTGSGEIEINTTKPEYHPGDPILILGNTGANVLLTVTMTDPDGTVIKEKETFSDKTGKISEDSFRIPSEATPGIWTINAKSGSNYYNLEIEVLGITEHGMLVSVEFIPKLDGVNDFINIHVVGAANSVEINIIADDGEIIEPLSFPASQDGIIDQPWKIPKDIEPGTYTIKVEDAFNSAETTFDIT